MPGMTLESGLISYYGNPAGYTEKNKAVVDRIFQCGELTAWLQGRGLAAVWTDGVMERLLAGERPGGAEYVAPLKNVRVWQLDPQVDVRMKFIGYADMLRQFGEPCPEDYRIAYEGQMDTNDPECIYERFSARQPSGFSGHLLSMSDVIELYDADGNEFYYVDRSAFQRIGFEPREQLQTMNMGM